MIYIVDTYAWVEYLIGSKQGKILDNLLKNKQHKFITMECCIAELVGWTLKNNEDSNKVLDIIKHNSIILPVLTDHWKKAAILRHEFRKKISDFGLIDSILVAKQQELKCKVISGDKHFKTLKDVVYIAA